MMFFKKKISKLTPKENKDKMVERKNIYELITLDFNPQRELNSIEDMWKKNLIISYQSNRDRDISCIDLTIEKFVDLYLFPQWKSRDFCVNCADMKERLENSISDLKDELKLLIRLEYYKSILILFIKKASPLKKEICTCKLSKFFYIMVKNIDLLIEKLSLQEIYDHECEIIYLVPKSSASIAAAEVSSTRVGLAILKYNHALLKGNLNEKRKLLTEIVLEYEGLLKQPPQECKKLCEKTRALINNMNIRHNNTKESDIFNKFTPKEKEEWYDEIYQMLLLCVLEKDNISRMKRVEKLLSSL